MAASSSSSSSIRIPSIANKLLRTKAFVNGQWTEAASGQRYKVLNPADKSLITDLPDMQASDAAAAIRHASLAFDSWRRLTPTQRCATLLKWEQQLLQHSEELASLLTWESGKVLAEARAEVAYGASFVGWFAEEARRVVGQTLQGPTPDKRVLTLRQPQGVCSMITPWNFPIAMVTRKAGAALAAGCSVVLKPAEDTPLSALAVCDLACEAGVPAGVLNIVTCSRDNAKSVGRELATNPIVRHVSFTGSTVVGKQLTQLAAGTMKRVTMELGGCAPFIVFESADLHKAAAGLVGSKFRNSGQTCICPNRILVQEQVFEQFVQLLKVQVEQLKVGQGFAEGVQLGPLINSSAGDKIRRMIDDAVAKGASVVAGGKQATVENCSSGEFFEPTILTNVPQTAACFTEEIFGPIAAIYKFSTESEALAIANNTSSGLAGYFYSTDASQCWRVAEALNVGMVGQNEAAISNCLSPFGGVGESGIGRESGVGYGIQEYLDLKSVEAFGSSNSSSSSSTSTAQNLQQ